MACRSEPGDLAIWYAASPDQEYRAYGWVSGTPVKPSGELMKYYGPVAGVRLLAGPVPRHVVGAASGFNEKGVGQLAEVVYQRVDDFLLALGFPERFVAARELISDEIDRAVRSMVDFPPCGPMSYLQPPACSRSVRQACSVLEL